MAFRFSFFKTPKHKVFHYTPLYWDQEKEEREKRLEQAREKARAALEAEGHPVEEPDPAKRKPYVPGAGIRGSMRSAHYENRRYPKGQDLVKWIVIVSILAAVMVLLYTTRMFTLFFDTLFK